MIKKVPKFSLSLKSEAVMILCHQSPTTSTHSLHQKNTSDNTTHNRPCRPIDIFLVIILKHVSTTFFKTIDFYWLKMQAPFQDQD